MSSVSAPTRHWRLTSREAALILLFWMSLATLSAVNRLLDARDFGFQRVFTASGPIALAYIEAAIWAAFTPLIFWLSSSSSLIRTRWVRIPLYILAGVAIAIVVYLLLDFARTAIMPVPVRRRGGGGGAGAFMPLRQIGRFRFMNQMIVYLAVLAAGFAREYSLRDQKRQREAMVLATETARLEAQLAAARLDALRMQMNPHFLFNTLNAVSALVERDPAGVRRMIARLSELLRHTIDSRATDEVPLRDEVAFLQRYIEIMEVRFQGRLEVTLAIDGAVRDAMVPNLVLQPIVENALEHGVSRIDGAGKIDITALHEDDDLVLLVRDNGPGPDPSFAAGVGLANTRARLAQLYGDAAELTLTPGAHGGAIARIVLPFHTTARGGDA